MLLSRSPRGSDADSTALDALDTAARGCYGRQPIPGRARDRTVVSRRSDSDQELTWRVVTSSHDVGTLSWGGTTVTAERDGSARVGRQNLRKARPAEDERPSKLTQELVARWWPAVERRLRTSLRAWDSHVVDDLCQHAAMRVLENLDKIAGTEEDLTRWVLVVARRDSWRWQRRRGREAIMDFASWDIQTGDDVERAVESRVRLRRVLTAIPGLPKGERAAVLARLAGKAPLSTKTEQDAAASSLARARRRLGRLGVPVALGWRRSRLAWSELSAPVTALGSAAVAVGVAGLFALGPTMPHGDSDQRAAPRTREPLIRPASVAAIADQRPAVTSNRGQRGAEPDAAQAPAARGDVEIPKGAPVVGNVIRDRRPGEPMLCAANMRVIADTCVDHPLRDAGPLATPKVP